MSGFSFKNVRYPRYQDTAFLQLWVSHIGRSLKPSIFTARKGEGIDMLSFLSGKSVRELVEGYSIPFTGRDSRTGRKAQPALVLGSAPGPVRKARLGSLAVRGCQLFNLLPVNWRNSDHGDIPMFKNHLDIFLSNIPD